MTSPLPASSINAIAITRTEHYASINCENGLQAIPTPSGLLILCLPLSSEDRLQFASVPPDSTWLAMRLSRQHEETTRISARYPVYPLQFGMLASGTEELLAALQLRAAELHGYFKQIEGCCEWSIRLTCSVEVCETLPEEDTALSGIEWLKRRKAAPETARLTRLEQVERLRLAIQTRLYPLARTALERAVQVEPPGRETLLSVALLLSSDRADDARKEVTSLAESLSDDMELTFSGPWAPYSFRPRLDAG